MSVSTAPGNPLETDLNYSEGMAHLQAGQWEAAIDCFEELARRYPDSPTAQSVLRDVRFKADLDAGSRVRPRRWRIPWRPLLVRGVIVVAIGMLAWEAAHLVTRQVAPVLADSRAERRRAEELAEAATLLEAGNLDAAKAICDSVLAEAPDDELALAAMAQVVAEREIQDLYQKAVALQGEEEWGEALGTFTQIDARTPRYRDVRQRIVTLRRYHDLDGPFAEAEVAFEAGLTLDAIHKYEHIRGLDVSYRSDTVVTRLVDLHVQAGRELVEANPPEPEVVPQAAEHFRQALALKPRSAEATAELQMALLFLEGQEAYNEGLWSEAVSRLRGLYYQRPEYLGTTVVNLLHNAYLKSGDDYRLDGDGYLAYEQYRKAAQLPVDDTKWAQRRLAQVVAMLTPTPTPTPTLTPTPTPTITPMPSPTGTPVIKPVSQGPLVITAPYYYIIERHLVRGAPEWEGHIGVFYSGGMAPYSFALDNGPRQSDNYLSIRWRICEPAPVTLHIWSADGQEVHQAVLILKWCG